MKRTALPAAALAAALAPLAAALALALGLRLPPHAGGVGSVPLVPVYAPSPAGLARLFARYDYGWPPAGRIPALGVLRLPPGLAGLEPGARKRLFLQTVLPLVVAANDAIRAERKFARRAFAAGQAGTDTRAGRRLRRLARRYRVAAPLTASAGRAMLLRRCDTVPAGLVLAQAAKESGWGTSDFALAANNLFGIWTWDRDAGIAPGDAAAAAHRVRSYPDLLQSVRDYLYNLDVGHAYGAFRRRRAAARAHGRPPDVLALAATLERYSIRGPLYADRLSRLIAENGLDSLSRQHLAPEP